jgi:type VI secretion system protein ImpG
MSDSVATEKFLQYYERELLFIRQMAREFAQQHPAIADRLRLETERSTDPHVERVIEAFAFLTARVHNKIDDEFPELTDALLGILYPHYLAPIPSMSVVQFQADGSRLQSSKGFPIPQHSSLKTRPVGENALECRFRTGYPVTLWPIEVKSARFQPPPFPQGLQPPPRTAAALFLQLHCLGEAQFKELELEKLRFYLSGDKPVVANLYQVLFNHTLQVVFRPVDRNAPQAPVVLAPRDCLSPVGFERDEGLLPYPNQSFLGYRLLSEFFAFPAKFQFLDLGGWQQLRKKGYGNKVEVIFFFDRTMTSLEQGIDATSFRLGSTPIVNLFKKTAEPIQLTHARPEYLIKPDVAHPDGMEVYEVKAVTSVDEDTKKNMPYQPFYSFRHGQAREAQRAFWYMTRRPAPQIVEDRGTDVYLHLVDLDFNPRLPAEKVAVVETMCTNRDLPNRLRQGGDELYFELEAAAPLAAIHCLRRPTPTLRPPLRRGAHWRLLSHQSLNHLSLSRDGEVDSRPRDGEADTDIGSKALKELLRLYDFSDPDSGDQLGAVTQQIIDGILSLSSRRVVGRTDGAPASGFARGVQVTIEFDERQYVGVGVHLFASVLERFLGLYASMNSFTQLIGKTRGEGYFKKWPPRAAERQLL